MEARRRLGLPSATALVVASMVGAGAFTLSGELLEDLGRPGAVLLAWAAGGLFALLGALCYGALGRRLPESGGEYLFLSRTVHPAAGFVAGWVSLVVGFSAPLALVAAALGAYTRTWFGGLAPEWIATAAILGAGALHAVRVELGAAVQNGVVALKLLLLAAFVGLWVLSPGSPPPLEAGGLETGAPGGAPGPWSWTAFGAALIQVSFAYSGWNAAVYLGGEVRDPKRNLPRSLLLGTLTVTALYLLLNAAFLDAAPPEKIQGEIAIGRVAGLELGGQAVGEAMSGLIALALLTSVSGMVMAGPRVYARMAADRVFPQVLRGGPGAPRAAIALQLALALVMVWTASFGSLLTYTGFTLSLSTAATVVGLLHLRRREGPAGVPIPGHPVVPVLFLAGVLAVAAATVAEQPTESLWGLATLAAGYLIWFAARQGGKGGRPEG